jgi:prepilin-type processing-associated H-X9-DG protein
MTDPTHQQLLGHLLGALDDDEQKLVDERLDNDADCCRELTRWRRLLTPLEMMRPDFEPPAGLAARTCRYVAAAALKSMSDHRRPGMTPLPLPPGGATGVRWLDAAFITLSLLFFVAMIPPAICGSRFQSRLALCQDGLRRFGLALTEYGYCQNSGLSTLADNGRLTSAGVFAAGMLRDGRPSADRRKACPDAWLAAQGLATPANVAATNGPRLSLQSRDVVLVADNRQDVGGDAANWSGMWRNGTTYDRQVNPTSVASPLLADAPSADVPDQPQELCHGGRGRNLFFADGHVAFVGSRPAENAANDAVLTPVSFATGGVPSQTVLTRLYSPDSASLINSWR